MAIPAAVAAAAAVATVAIDGRRTALIRAAAVRAIRS